MNVSIAMATYNGERFLQEQLDSLAAQTLLPLELVVGDDGSTDGTLEILERFARRAPFPVHIQKNAPTLGYGENFLSTASRCSGEWIAFCDQDDVWLPHKLEKHSLAIALAPSVDLVASRAIRVDEVLSPVRSYSTSGRSDHIAQPRKPPLRTIAGHCLTFRKALLIEFPWKSRPLVPFADHRVSHDQWISVLGYLFGSRYISSEQLIMWRRHKEAATYDEWHSMVEWLRNNWRVSESQYKQQGLLWKEVGRWCEESTTVVAPARRDALSVARGVCQEVTRWYAERSSLFGLEQDRLARSGGLLRLVRAGAYRRGFGVAAFAKDVVRVIV
jgi:glycosyltransferase involved in cell wall biosynthesis